MRDFGKRKSPLSYETNKFFLLKDNKRKNSNYDDFVEKPTDRWLRNYKYTPNKYSKETKYKIATYAKQFTVRIAADKYNIPKTTVQSWIEPFNKYGAAAFFKKGEKIPEVKDGEEPVIEEVYPEIPNIQKKGGKEKIIYEEDEESYEDPLNSANNLTRSHIRIDMNKSKLPDVEGWKKIHLIAPSLRLWAAKEGLKENIEKKALSEQIGVNISSLNKWIYAYKVMGAEAHIFKTNRKLYSGIDNGGRYGVTKFSLQFKKEAIDRSLTEGTFKVGFELGISPDTIRKWKKILSYPRPIVDECENIVVPDWYAEGSRYSIRGGSENSQNYTHRRNSFRRESRDITQIEEVDSIYLD